MLLANEVDHHGLVVLAFDLDRGCALLGEADDGSDDIARLEFLIDQQPAFPGAKAVGRLESRDQRPNSWGRSRSVEEIG